VIPVLSGLSEAVGAAEVTDAFRTALMIAAVIAAMAAPIAFVGLGRHARGRASARQRYCPLDGPPLQPDPTRCPAPLAR
jgi:hypothetical protein